MRTATSYVKNICKLYSPPEKPNADFDDEDIMAFEKILGVELPADYYEFLKRYGFGSFDEYFYINYPFVENGAEKFILDNNNRKTNYDYLERHFTEPINGNLAFVDCKFADGELTVIAGNPKLAVYLRTEKIDEYTRSKIIALGNHYPYIFYPQEGGLICLGYTDDDEFFFRIMGDKTSIVMYSDGGYYEFNMSFTEFVYGYLTQTIKLPMQNEDNTKWEFCVYE